MTACEQYVIACQLPTSKFLYGDACVVTIDVPVGATIRFANLEAVRDHFQNMSLDRVLDKKSYAIRKREMVRVAHRVRSMSYDNLQMMAGDKLEVTILPVKSLILIKFAEFIAMMGVQSSLLISVLWISSIIFITVLFTYTYSALQELWWN